MALHAEAQSPQSPSDLLTTAEVLARYRRNSRRTLVRWMETKGFPAPVISGTGAPSLWRRGDLDEFDELLQRKKDFIKGGQVE